MNVENCTQDGKIKEIADRKEFTPEELKRWRNDPHWWQWPIQPSNQKRPWAAWDYDHYTKICFEYRLKPYTSDNYHNFIKAMLHQAYIDWYEYQRSDGDNNGEQWAILQDRLEILKMLVHEHEYRMVE